MGLRFQRRIKIAPGITLNVGKKGVSTSIGTRGAHVTVGQNGVRTTVGIPGTGISYTKLVKPGTPSASSASLPYLKTCPYCGHGMRKRWDACPACHHPLNQPLPPGMARCAHCGTVYTKSPNFCGRCGHPMLGVAPDPYPELTPEAEKLYADNGCIACPSCHGPVPEKFHHLYCPNCGAALPASEASCYGCMIMAAVGVFFLCYTISIFSH